VFHSMEITRCDRRFNGKCSHAGLPAPRVVFASLKGCSIYIHACVLSTGTRSHYIVPASVTTSIHLYSPPTLERESQHVVS
jgi:hypothetical protein